MLVIWRDSPNAWDEVPVGIYRKDVVRPSATDLRYNLGERQDGARRRGIKGHPVNSFQPDILIGARKMDTVSSRRTSRGHWREEHQDVEHRADHYSDDPSCLKVSRRGCVCTLTL